MKIVKFLESDVLTTPAVKVESFPLDPVVLEKMDYLLRRNKGLGLAAPQVGIGQRFFILNRPGSPIVNPEVDVFGTDLEEYEEGCLSFPWTDVKVIRPTVIRLKYQDERGRPLTETFSIGWARVVQHELDHLNGKGLWDYLK